MMQSLGTTQDATVLAQEDFRVLRFWTGRQNPDREKQEKKDFCYQMTAQYLQSLRTLIINDKYNNNFLGLIGNQFQLSYIN